MNCLKSCVLAVLAAVAMLSCTHEEGSRPEIKRDKLVDVLFDIHLVDGYLAYSGTRVDRDRNKIENAYWYVLRKHNVTPRQFDNTMKYYSNHIDDYEKIYNKVIEKLTRYETENLNSAGGDGRKSLEKPERNKR